MSPAHRVVCALCLLAAVLVGAGLPARAQAPAKGPGDSLATVRMAALPALPAAGPLLGLVALDGRPVALWAQAAWVLSADQKSWAATAWQPPAPLVGVAANASAAYALLGADGRAEQVHKLALLQGQPRLSPLAPLPMALSQARASVLGGKLFLAGLDAQNARVLLQTEPGAAQPGWLPLPAWPDAGAVSSLVGQTSALFITLQDAAGATPAERMLRWSADRGWTALPPPPGRIVAGSGRAMGQAHVLYLVQPGGAAADSAPQLMSFHTITGSWATLAAPDAAGVRAVAAWNNGIVWERAAADGTHAFGLAEVESGKLLLKWLDWVVIVVYLVSMLGIGLYFYLREKRNSTSDFFVGGRSIPFWAAGVSLYAANTSSISYIAIPAKAFETNWQYLTNNLVAVLGLMFVAVWIVPLLRRLDLMSVFSYLERASTRPSACCPAACASWCNSAAG
jgi:SSS family solute:Na+ symporter